MADIRINQLPLATGPTAPMQSDVLPIDGTNTRKATLLSLADVINPPASQAEAEAGTDAVKRMTPLTTAQAISASGASLLGLGTAAFDDVGTSAGTVAAGDDPRITGAVQSKKGTNPNSSGQPSGTFAATIYNAVNATGENGLLVKNNWIGDSGVVLEVGSDVVGGAYTSLMTVGNSVPGNLTGNYEATSRSIKAVRDTSLNDVREVTAEFSIVADKGNGHGGSFAAGDKIAVYMGAIAKNGSLNVFTQNNLLEIQSDSTSQGNWIVEFDLNNYKQHMGDNDVLSLPLAWGVDITGAGNFRSTAAIHIGSLNSGVLPTGIWNRGILFDNPSCRIADVESRSISTFFLRDMGSHQYGLDLVLGTYSNAAIRLKNAAPIAIRSSDNSHDVSVLYMDAGGFTHLNGDVGLALDKPINFAASTTANAVAFIPPGATPSVPVNNTIFAVGNTLYWVSGGVPRAFALV